MPRKTTKSTPASKYENNPFFVAANGITLLFNLAVGVAVVMVVLSVLSFIGNNVSPDSHWWNTWEQSMSVWSASQWILAGGSTLVIGLALAMISALLGGVSAYTSYHLVHGERTSVSDAFREAFDKLWSYLWLQVLIGFKIFLWTLLFVIPGVVMAFRYSLAGVSFFDKDLRGMNAIKDSLRLTKGAWITTFASNMLFSFLTFGFFSPVISTAVNAVLYQQFSELKDKPKPAAHWLSWVTLGVPFVLVAFGFTLLIGMLIGIAVGGTN